MTNEISLDFIKSSGVANDESHHWSTFSSGLSFGFSHALDDSPLTGGLDLSYKKYEGDVDGYAMSAWNMGLSAKLGFNLPVRSFILYGNLSYGFSFGRIRNEDQAVKDLQGPCKDLLGSCSLDRLMGTYSAFSGGLELGVEWWRLRLGAGIMVTNIDASSDLLAPQRMVEGALKVGLKL